MAERGSITDEARSSHNAGLRALLERLENDITEIIRGDGLTGHEAVMKNDWNGSAQYKHKFQWKIENGHITEIFLNLEEEPLFKLIARSSVAKSNSDARRLVQSNAVQVDEQKISDLAFQLDYSKKGEYIVKVGKRRFIKYVVE